MTPQKVSCERNEFAEINQMLRRGPVSFSAFAAGQRSNLYSEIAMRLSARVRRKGTANLVQVRETALGAQVPRRVNSSSGLVPIALFLRNESRLLRPDDRFSLRPHPMTTKDGARNRTKLPPEFVARRERGFNRVARKPAAKNRKLCLPSIVWGVERMSRKRFDGQSSHEERAVIRKAADSC